MGDEGGTPGGDPAAGAPAAGTPAPAAGGSTGFTQEQVDRLVGQARTEGRTSGEKTLLESLGVDTADAAKAKIVAANEAEQARLTETQRLEQERDEAKKRETAALQRADETLRMARVETELVAAGIKPDRIAAAMRQIDLSAVTVDGNEVRGAKEAAEKLAEQFPEWKGATPPAGAGAPDASRGGPASNGDKDFRTASAEDTQRELSRYSLR